GVLALAFLVENGLEAWSALFLERTFDSSPAVSGLGPGLFAAAMAAGRLSAQRIAPSSVTARMTVAGIAAAAGAATAAPARAPAPHRAIALFAFVVAGAGLALSAPTLFGAAGRIGGPGGRGAAVSTVAILGYLGFLAGPPLIGGVAGATSLRGAFVYLCVVALLVAASAPLL